MMCMQQKCGALAKHLGQAGAIHEPPAFGFDTRMLEALVLGEKLSELTDGFYDVPASHWR